MIERATRGDPVVVLNPWLTSFVNPFGIGFRRKFSKEFCRVFFVEHVRAHRKSKVCTPFVFVRFDGGSELV